MATVHRPATRARTAVFAPLGDAGRAVRVAQRLEQAIRAGILAEGERLPSEPELASMLGVATVTAREALVSLRAQGLVTTVRGHGGGSFVTRPEGGHERVTRQRLAAMTKVELGDHGTHYSAVLAGCAELAAERADTEEVAELREIVALGRPRDDAPEPTLGEVRHADTELHLAIAALTQSARLAREVVRMESDFGVVLRLPLGLDEHRTRIHDLQQQLIAAIGHQDPAAARAVMRRRVQETLGALARMRADALRGVEA
ncbi:FadR/GntR family transcriptional regulator [Nocardioides sp.]|uniref:FadR/GntR family transcriptional regulator n=1 Tax=Nocardioides sp. TaxID=35761 RepID=UPI0035157881